MAASDPSAQMPKEDSSDSWDRQAPNDAHLTPSHAFPPTADSGTIDPEYARATLSKTDSTDSEEHEHHHCVEKGYESCASCRAKGQKPFQGHADREEGCTCMVGEGAVPAGEGNAGKGGSQHGMRFLPFFVVVVVIALAPP